VIGGGFAVVNIVICGQMLAAVSDYTMTISVGCVIVGIISYAVSLFGFKVIHTYEKYAWIAGFILIAVLIGQAAPHVDPSAPGYDSGLSLAGSFLSFMAICFSSSSGWCSIAADYYCNYPAKTPAWKIFSLTVAGVTIPTVFVTVIGACIGNAAILAEYPPYATAYDNHGLGGVLREAYHPLGWSKFALVPRRPALHLVVSDGAGRNRHRHRRERPPLRHRVRLRLSAWLLDHLLHIHPPHRGQVVPAP
jgi:purine-cytosine permease-like protein